MLQKVHSPAESGGGIDTATQSGGINDRVYQFLECKLIDGSSQPEDAAGRGLDWDWAPRRQLSIVEAKHVDDEDAAWLEFR